MSRKGMTIAGWVLAAGVILAGSVAGAAAQTGPALLTNDQTVTGYFDPAQPRVAVNGVFGAVNRYGFDADTGQAATVILAGPDVVYQYLVISGPGGLRAESDSRTLPTPFRIASGRAPVAGRYYCDVVAGDGGVGDTYELKLTVSETEIILFRAGDLNFGDPALPNGAYVEEYRVAVAAGDRLLVSMVSAAIDPYLYVRLPGETAILENDNRDTGTRDSEIVVTAPVAGELTVGASSAPLPRRVSPTGGYLLAIERAPGPIADPAAGR